MAEYELRNKVIVESDTSGLEKVTEDTKKASSAAEQLTRQFAIVGDSAEEAEGKAAEAFDKMGSVFDRSKSSLLKDIAESHKSVIEGMIEDGGFDKGTIAKHILGYQKELEQAAKGSVPKNMMTPELAKQLADQATQVDLLKMKVEAAAERYTELVNNGASLTAQTSAFNTLVTALQKYDEALEKASQNNGNLVRAVTPEQANEFANNINRLVLLKDQLNNANAKLAQYMQNRLNGDTSTENNQRIDAMIAKIQRIQSQIEKAMQTSAPFELSEGIEQIGHSADSAADSVDNLADSLRRTASVLEESPSFAGQSAWDEVASRFSEGQGFNAILGTDAIGNANFATAMNLRLGDAFEFAGRAADLAVSGVSKFTSAIGNAARSKVDRFVGGLNNIVSSFKRIAFYRFIRSIIRSITEGFKEGVDNLYQWSKALNGEFAKSMDKIATASLYMKNSLGAMVAPLLNALAPAIDYIIDRFVDLLNIINQVFAVLTGAGYWTKAIKYPHEYAKAAKGAGDATKKLGLAGIDQLTILDKNKGSSGSGFTAEDYAGMFKNEKIGGVWEDIKKAIDSGQWREAGKILAEHLNGIIDQWDAHAWGLKLGKKINNGLEFAYGFLKNLDFTNIGKKLAESFNGLLEGINFDTLGRLLVRKRTAFWDTLIGFFENLDWKGLGKSISNFFTGALNELTEWARDVDWFKLATDLWFGFKEMIGEIDFDTIASDLFELFGIALGAAVSFLSAPILDIVQSISDYFLQFIEDENNDGHFGADEIINGIFEGIDNALKGIGQWIKEHIFDPFLKGIKEAFGIASPAKEMMPIGENVIEGFKEGITKKWTQFVDGFKKKWEDFKNWWRGLSLPEFKIKTPHLSWTTQPASGWVANILSLLGMPTSVPKLNISWYAKGGFPDAGDLFIANESGAEMVGSMNGRTTVANQQEITEGIRQGVYDAVTSAMASGSFNANVYLDGKQISGTVVQNINSETRRTGNSPLLSY